MSYFLTLGSILFVYMNLWFILSLLKKRNDVADVAWGSGFVVLAWASFFITGKYGPQSILVSTLVTVWGLRLSWHIYTRNKGKTEDYRYKKWREEWDKWFYLRSYFQVYILQGSLLFVIILPVLLINKTAVESLSPLTYSGLAIWIIGFLFESVGDWQLAKFLKNSANKGKLMISGLWKYTRHPNYFGEVTQWWGLWVVSLSVPYGWLAIIGPLTITFLILNISGIPMLEKKMEKHPNFAEYKRKTSLFIPWPSKI
ncbi:MAG: steroid 5-alpha reductase [delta proteobacterium ML8_D]|jgi:steroid 5-alpha reductase family enzyme|nr:MAG: steroid 5-alpha reductase [delta proteobacterium ML8_D]